MDLDPLAVVRDPLTYQEQFVAGVLVALHLEQVRRFVERWYRQVIAGALAVLVAATLWYLVAVWTGSTTGRASDLYQPIAFLWFTAAVGRARECGTYKWYQRTVHGHPPRIRWLSAISLADLTGGIFLCHVLFLTLLLSALGASGLGPHLGWAGTVAVLYPMTVLVSAAFVRADPSHAAAVGARRAGELRVLARRNRTGWPPWRPAPSS